MGPPQKSLVLPKRKKLALPHALMQLSRSTFCVRARSRTDRLAANECSCSPQDLGQRVSRRCKWYPRFETGSPADASQKAIRVDTPPLKEDTADGKPRGLFFDVSGPSDAGPSDSGAGGSESASTRASKKETHKNEAQALSEPKRRREWWDPYPKTLAAATTTAASRRDLIRKAAAFEFDVPEHLPNSPMCPANPKHKSGGKGVCVVRLSTSV